MELKCSKCGEMKDELKFNRGKKYKNRNYRGYECKVCIKKNTRQNVRQIPRSERIAKYNERKRIKIEQLKNMTVYINEATLFISRIERDKYIDLNDLNQIITNYYNLYLTVNTPFDYNENDTAGMQLQYMYDKIKYKVDNYECEEK